MKWMTALLLAMSFLLTACSTATEDFPTEDIVVQKPMPPLPPLDGSDEFIADKPYNQDPSAYDILRDAKDHLEYNPEDGNLFIYMRRIDSFDFLNDFPGIKALSIYECYIPEGVAIPKTDALNEITSIAMYGIYGSGAAGVLMNCLPLPKLELLEIQGKELNKAPLPAIPSLTDLHVSAPNVMELISNNTHITGSLRISSNLAIISSVSGIEKFSHIQYLELPPAIRDISPLSGCSELRILKMIDHRFIDSLEPLYDLACLEEIIINDDVYNTLSKSDRERFSPMNNGDANAVHVYGVNDFSVSNNGEESLTLSGQKIKSFDFLKEYPSLKYLCIIDCDIDDGLVLPRIDTLVHLEVYDRNVLELIKNNTHLTGRLSIGASYPLYGEDGRLNTTLLSDLNGLEAFTSLETLSIKDPVHDISALSGCINLRGLLINNSPKIDTLEPIFALRRLRNLIIDPNAFRALPSEEQKRFDNRKPHLVQISWWD